MNNLDTILTQIAQQHLRIDTLDTRNSDSLDFHDVAVWCVRDALLAAFNAGVEQGVSKPEKLESFNTQNEIAESSK